MYENLKKKYGQNFLIDNNILNKITDLISSSNLKILEIGPGDGRLTDNIIKKKIVVILTKFSSLRFRYHHHY